MHDKNFLGKRVLGLFIEELHGFGDPSMDPGNMGYIPSSIAYANSMNSDLRSISPQLVASDLSSPSCSE
uniref:Uncharacterized protein n=1 Tax=Romanomermis culicivorax TaxID=13658 RepID=A0A915HID5_ROMCU